VGVPLTVSHVGLGLMLGGVLVMLLVAVFYGTAGRAWAGPLLVIVLAGFMVALLGETLDR
jgi:hypothetical protein